MYMLGSNFSSYVWLLKPAYTLTISRITKNYADFAKLFKQSARK